MRANQAVFPIATMARVLGVSTAGYYAWSRRSPSARTTADAGLLKRIRTVHATSRGTYGAPRGHAELMATGQPLGRKRVARLMQAAGIVGVSRRRSIVTTRRDENARPAPDLVERNFTAERPNQLWVADITFIPTAAGFLYLAVVLDAWSRRIVGWARLAKVPTAQPLESQGRAGSAAIATARSSVIWKSIVSSTSCLIARQQPSPLGSPSIPRSASSRAIVA